MLVKDLIKYFSSYTRYSICYVDDVHNKVWWGMGNNPNTNVNDEEVIGIRHAPKEIVIYILGD